MAFGFLPCQGISSPRGHSDALSGSSGWSVGAGSACRTETGRKWAGYRTRRPLEIAGPGCKYLVREEVHPSHLFEKKHLDDHWWFKTRLDVKGTICWGICYVLLHETAKARQVGWHWWNSHDCTLGCQQEKQQTLINILTLYTYWMTIPCSSAGVIPGV